MKKNWLLYLVIFSLALNFGTIGALIYFRTQDTLAHRMEVRPPRPHLGKVLHALNLDEQQKLDLEQRLRLNRQKGHDLLGKLAQQRLQLFHLLQAEKPNEEQIFATVRTINENQHALEQQMVGFLLEAKKILRPEQQQELLHRVGQRLCGPGSCGPPPHRGRGLGGPR
ncbi:Spy/CpxP family protein refolding chaperone [Desulfobacca acetoxidans]|uniref:Periplasmic heavy metal sensor n=1 Tax=Desulfobacca acetoxidans (strain ATCC 700848 / DSM 11109 / ASRB2) TaxID=880072 RepID=F2NE17_DESAR|nr:periplasmic heavy metal sensor [Desulfobacca acetoxidans]AEB10585.1 hypothetical protein Desac_2772 [Desulfobacca acetoxidans DSM 11109]